MWVLYVIVIFIAWCRLSPGVKALVALFLVLAAPFTEYVSFAMLVILLILSSIFGGYF